MRNGTLPVVLVLLDAHERSQVKILCRKRLRTVLKGAVISYSLPFIVAISIWIFINSIQFYGSVRHGYTPHYIYPRSADQLSLYLKFNAIVWFSAFVVITVANLVMALVTIPAICIDLLRNKKAKFPFYPERKYFEHTGSCRIKTGVPKHLYLKVSQEVYAQIDETKPLYLAVLPLTGIYIGLTDSNDVSIPAFSGSNLDH